MLDGKKLSSSQTLTFEIQSNLKHLDQVLERFDQLYQPWIIKKDWLQCQLALAEGFTNAVRHAHAQLPEITPIKIEFQLQSERLEIRIWDQGSPFDLLEYLDKLQGKERQLQSHGQGLFILQKIATHLSYTRTADQQNCLLIIKTLSR